MYQDALCRRRAQMRCHDEASSLPLSGFLHDKLVAFGHPSLSAFLEHNPVQYRVHVLVGVDSRYRLLSNVATLSTSRSSQNQGVRGEKCEEGAGTRNRVGSAGRHYRLRDIS